MNDWIAIYVTSQLYQAEMIKSILEENDIKAVIMNQKDSSYKIGSITVMVNKMNAEKAAEIIKSDNCE